MDYDLRRHELGYREIENKPTPEALRAYYQERYYQNETGQYQADYSDDEVAYFRGKAAVCQATLSLYDRQATRLFELGAGEGFFAKYFKDQGAELTLNDLSTAGLERFHPELLPDLKTGDALAAIERLAAEGQTFDLISLDNVLEHVIDPEGLVSALKHLMSPASTLRITVPNDFSDFQMMLLRKGLTTETWIAPPDHLTYFNAANLVDFMQTQGLKILSTQVDFPIEVFLANPHSNYAQDRSLGKNAHRARVMCANYLVDQDVEAFVRYGEAAAKLQFGRDTTIYATL